MKNKFRRSMTSVLLAASLLFSSQSVIAFADYGSKSDASDLSPVQESVETVVKNEQTTFEETEESKEELTTSEKSEETTGTEESTTPEETTTTEQPAPAAPVTTPATLDAKEFNYSEHTFTYEKGDAGIASVSYYDKYGNSGTISEGKSITTESTLIHQNTTTFIVTTKSGYKLVGLTGDNVETNAFTVLGNNQYEFHFTDKSGFDFKEVSFSLETAKIEYEFIDEEGHSLGTATIGDTISLKDPEDNPDLEFVGWYVGDIKLEGSLTEDIIAYADENNQIKVEAKYEDNKPFWTFKADKNGKVQLNDEAPKDSIVFTKTQVEALNNGKDDFLYVVPNEGYGFAGCTGNQVLVETGLCLDNLNKNVEFYSTAHFNPLVNITFNPGDHGTLVDSSKSTGTITSDYNLAYLAFPEVTPDDGYKLVGWKREGSSEIETVSVKTPVEYVTEGITYIAQYEEVPAEKITDVEIEIGKTLQTLYPDLVNLWKRDNLHAEYNGGYIFLGNSGNGSSFETSVLGDGVGKIPDSLTTEIDTVDEAKGIFSGFTFMSKLFFPKEHFKNDIINSVRVEGTKIYITLELPAPEAPANINELLDVTLNCENPDHPDHPEEYGKSKTYSDLLPNSYTIGEVKNNNGTYTCDITINPEEYLADYNNVTKTNHILVTTPENLTGIATVTLKYEDGAWKTAESPVTFTVTCKQSIPLTPSKPSDDDVKAIMDKISVTVDCTNTTGHDPMNHTLTGAEFTVGDIYSVAPFADQDPVILCPVTINNYVSLQNGFITQYNAATNESHTLSSGFIPASIVLTYNKDAQDGKGAWENHDLENITLSLTCNPTTPGGGGEGTNPGGGGDNDDDDDRYTGGNTVTRTINDDDVPLNDRPTNTTTIDDEDVPLADLPDDTVTIDDGEVPLKDNPSTGDSLPFAAMAAAALSLGGVIVLNRKKK